MSFFWPRGFFVRIHGGGLVWQRALAERLRCESRHMRTRLPNVVLRLWLPCLCIVVIGFALTVRYCGPRILPQQGIDLRELPVLWGGRIPGISRICRLLWVCYPLFFDWLVG